MRLYGNLYWFWLLIVSMIEGIDHGFFQCLIGIIEETDRFCPILRFDNLLPDDVGAQVIQCGLNDGRHRAFEGWNFYHVVGFSLCSTGEVDNLHVGIGVKLLRGFAKHHRCHIFEITPFWRSYEQLHLLQNLLYGGGIEILCQATFNFPQMVINEQRRKVIKLNLAITSVVKWCSIRHFPQFG